MTEPDAPHIASVCWRDHLMFGHGDGKLETPDSLEKRVSAWKQDLGVSKVLWRQVRSYQDFHHFSAPGYRIDAVRIRL